MNCASSSMRCSNRSELALSGETRRGDRGLPVVRPRSGLAPTAFAMRSGRDLPRKPRSSACRTRRARASSAPTIHICANACTISTISPAGLSAIWRNQAAGPRTTRFPTTPSSSRAPWDRQSCWTMAATVSSGLIVEEATQTSHIAIVARSLGIPLVGAVEDIADTVTLERYRRRRRRRRARCICGRLRKSSRRFVPRAH